MRVEARFAALVIALTCQITVKAVALQTDWVSFPDYDGAPLGGFPCQLANDGKTIVTAMEGGQIAFRSTPSLLVTRIVKATSSPVRALTISPDVSQVAVGGENGELCVVQADTGSVKLLRPAFTNRSTYPDGPWPAVLKFSETSDRLFALYNNGSCWLGSPKTGTPLISRFMGFRVRGADVTPSLDRFVVSDNNRRLFVFQTDSGQLLNSWLVGSDRLGVPIFSPDGSRVGVLGGSWFKEYDWRTGALTRELTGSVGSSGAYTADGQSLVSLGYQPTAYQLNTGSIRILSWRKCVFSAFNATVDRLFVSHDSQSNDYYGNASQELVSIADNSVFATSVAEGSSRALAFSPNGQFVVQAAVYTAPILRKVTGEFVASLPLDFDSRYQSRPSVAVSPDGQFAAVTTRTSVSVCNLADRSFVTRLQDGNGICGSLGFTRDSARLLYLKDGQLRALDRTNNWQDVLVNAGPFFDLQTCKAAWAVVQGNNTISLIDTNTGTVTTVFADADSGWVRVSQNGQLLYVGKDNLIEVYALPSGSKQRIILLPGQEAAGSLAPQATEGEFLLQTWNVWAQTVQTYRFHLGWLEELSRVSSPSGDVPTLVASPTDNRFTFAGSGSLSGVGHVLE